MRKLRTKVVNVRRSEYDVYIGRPSKWGNPFILGVHGERDRVVDLHWRWLCGEFMGPKGEVPPTFDEIKNVMMGKRLGCHCFPELCHGDNYVYICDMWESGQLDEQSDTTK